MSQRPGSLLSLRLQNFGPHSDVTFEFPSALNIIVAPNGSGKSTLVNAIFLVFGGQTRGLNRGSTNDQFIKDNENEAHITVEIIDQSGSAMSLKRIITRSTVNAQSQQGKRRGAGDDDERHSSTSKFFINDRPVTKTDLQLLVERLKIQVDNMCQFLPQDRVDDFTKMTPVELLKNTEMAIGGRELLQQHDELKERAQHLLSCHSTVENKLSEVTRLKDLNRPLEAQITADTHRTNLESRLSNLRDIQLIQTFQTKKALAQQAKEIAEQVGSALATVEKDLFPVEKTLEQKSRNLSSLSDNEFTKLKRVITENLKAQQTASVQFSQSFDAAKSARMKVRERIDELRRTRERIPQLRAEYREKKQALGERRSAVEDEEEARKLHVDYKAAEDNRIRSEQTMRTAQQEASRIQHRADVLKNRHQQLQSVQQRRLDALQNSDPDTYRAAIWLNDNKNRMEKEVFGPVQTLINPSSKLAARILENIVPNRDLRAFITQTSNDQKQLAALSKPPTGWKINVNYSGNIPESLSKLDIEPLRKFGIDAVLSDLFVCPPFLKHYLCASQNLHMIPVCTRPGIKVNTQAVFETNRSIRTIATEEFLHLASNMRYGNGARLFSDIGLSDHVRHLVESIDPKQIADCETEIASTNAQLEQAKQAVQSASLKYNEASQSSSQLRELIRSILDRQKITRRMQIDLDRTKNALKASLCETIDFKRIAAEAQRELDATVTRQLRVADDNERAARAVNDAIRRGCELAVGIRVLERVITDSSERVTELRAVHQQRLAEKREADNEHGQAKAAALELKRSAKEAAGRLQRAGIDIQSQTDADAVRREISELQNEIDALQAPMDAHQRQIYEERCQRIAQLEEEVQNGRLNADTERTRLEKDGAAWRRVLTETCEGLSQYFGDSMKSFGQGCSGEVRFAVPEDLSSYNQYGLELHVAFRASMPRRQVSPAYQSGGERAVTALNFILGLHHFTQSPFVVVDELNQGMDPINERRSYQYLARATEAATSQFIWITPKATHLNTDVFSTPTVAMITIGKRLADFQISIVDSVDENGGENAAENRREKVAI